jgi:hypothetical protein
MARVRQGPTAQNLTSGSILLVEDFFCLVHAAPFTSRLTPAATVNMSKATATIKTYVAHHLAHSRAE